MRKKTGFGVEQHNGRNIMKGFNLFFTGISGSGKSTIASEVKKKLGGKLRIQIIDGDVLRSELGNLFGYTREERMKNSHVVRVLAKYLSENEINTIVAIVAPYEEMRNEFREYIGDNYIQVYIKCSLDECARRDVKEYYARQKKGEMCYLNGADDVFEVPINSELVVDTEKETVEECTQKICRYLEEKGYVL